MKEGTGENEQTCKRKIQRTKPDSCLKERESKRTKSRQYTIKHFAEVATREEQKTDSNYDRYDTTIHE